MDIEKAITDGIVFKGGKSSDPLLTIFPKVSKGRLIIIFI